MNFRRNKKNNKKINVNRLQFVMAIIFLLVGFVLFKLYELQILKYDLYVALAMDQHQVFRKLNPERGKIFVQNDPYIFGKNLYPVATNKEFASIFAVPEDIHNPQEVAEKLYEFFDHEEVLREIEETLEEDEYFRDMYDEEGNIIDKQKEEFRKIKKEIAAQGGLIIINDREFHKPINGQDLVLTINRSIQFVICEKLSKAVPEYGADSGTVIVMEPKTGAIIAMCSWPSYDSNNYNKVEDVRLYNNPAIFDQYEPGSIFKIMTIAAGIDSGAIAPETVYEDKGFIMVEGWNKPIKNSDFDTYGPHGIVDMVTVLEASLNTGSIFVMRKTGEEKFAQYVKNFGFGEKTGIELETEYAGDIRGLTRKVIRPVEVATASFEQGITVTPLQVITAFAAIANGGILMKPYIVGKIVSSEGEQITEPRQIRRVVSEKTALLTSGMMVNVVDGGHAKMAAVEGYYVAGKTGTAQVASRDRSGYGDETIHTFVGFAPVDDPKFVMLVKLDNPRNVRFSASSAAPLFSRLAEFILNYYQVPKER